jgi:hypothetical protein
MMMMDCHTPWSMSYLWEAKTTHTKEFWIGLPTGVWHLGLMLGLVGYCNLTVPLQLFINALSVDRSHDDFICIAVGHGLDSWGLIPNMSKTFPLQ